MKECTVLSDANGAAGLDQPIRQVRTPDDVQEAVRRAPAGPIRDTVEQSLGNPQDGVFLWGETGLLAITLLETPLDGRFAWVTWGQSDRRIPPERVLPVLIHWCEQRNCGRIAGAVEKGTPLAWQRLTGFAPWKLILSVEF